MGRLPFIFPRETERAAIDRVFRDARKRQMLYDMIDAVLRVRESGIVSDRELSPILIGFEATDEGIWGRAAGWLAKLYGFSPNDVTPTLQQLANDSRYLVRFHLCACLDKFPRDIAIQYLRGFLIDKSAQIRGTVVNVAVKAGYSELIPDFKTLLATERDDEQREDLRQALALLRGKTFKREGAHIRKLADGSIEYRLAKPTGRVAKAKENEK